MMNQHLLLIQMHQNQMIGMMTKMENGKHHKLIIQTIKVNGNQNEYQILIIKENGNILKYQILIMLKQQMFINEELLVILVLKYGKLKLVQYLVILF